MISNATNPLKESRKESLLRCAGSTSICVWLVCDLVVMCVLDDLQTSLLQCIIPCRKDLKRSSSTRFLQRQRLVNDGRLRECPIEFHLSK